MAPRRAPERPVSGTMLLVTVNSGSTSIKVAAFEASPGEASWDGPLRRIAAVHHEGTHLEPAEELRAFLQQLPGPPAALAHRVVHGADRFTHPVRIDAAVRVSIGELAALAPLHNPLALRWIDAARALCDRAVAQVAVFDTAYFAGLPRVAAEYALPSELGWDLGVRRYGFHGLAHEAMWRRWCELNPGLERGGRLISVQLGGGCSITARDPHGPRDTSMGFSPLEGLVMASRCGDIDAAVVPYLAERRSLALCICLVDSNVPPRPNDRQLLDWLRSRERDFVVVATKIDRMSGNERTRNLAALKRGLEVEEILPVSAKTSYGIKELWRRIAEAGTEGPRD